MMNSCIPQPIQFINLLYVNWAALLFHSKLFSSREEEDAEKLS